MQIVTKKFNVENALERLSCTPSPELEVEESRCHSRNANFHKSSMLITRSSARATLQIVQQRVIQPHHTTATTTINTTSISCFTAYHEAGSKFGVNWVEVQLMFLDVYPELNKYPYKF